MAKYAKNRLEEPDREERIRLPNGKLSHLFINQDIEDGEENPTYYALLEGPRGELYEAEDLGTSPEKAEKRFDRLEKVYSKRIYTSDPNKCPQNMEFVQTFSKRNGELVRGYCRKRHNGRK